MEEEYPEFLCYAILVHNDPWITGRFMEISVDRNENIGSNSSIGTIRCNALICYEGYDEVSKGMNYALRSIS